jgi:alanine dehydrogenase
MKPQGTLLLRRDEVAELLTLGECIERVKIAFRQYAAGKSSGTGLLNLKAGDVEFHIKAGGLELEKSYFALKVNGGSFNNRERFGLPNIMGLIILFDGITGYPLAVLDSIEITIKRTGAATAVAAKYLALPDCNTGTICGCGNQGRIQLEALMEILPLRRVYAFDSDISRAQDYAEEMSKKLSLEVIAAADLREALSISRIVVTCTPSKKSFLPKNYVQPGTLVAAVGADSPEKQEIDPGLMVSNKVVVDILDQCARVGELHHALEERLLRTDEVYAELGEIVLGKFPGRTSHEEIIVYDATGTAIQDVAAAALAYEKAVRSGRGSFFDFLELGLQGE